MVWWDISGCRAERAEALGTFSNCKVTLPPHAGTKNFIHKFKVFYIGDNQAVRKENKLFCLLSKQKRQCVITGNLRRCFRSWGRSRTSVRSRLPPSQRLASHLF